MGEGFEHLWLLTKSLKCLVYEMFLISSNSL